MTPEEIKKEAESHEKKENMINENEEKASNDKLIRNIICSAYDCYDYHDCGMNHICTPYNLAVKVAEQKDQEFEKEKQAWIDKACEWMLSHLQMQYDSFGSFINAFRKAMKGGEE